MTTTGRHRTDRGQTAGRTATWYRHAWNARHHDREEPLLGISGRYGAHKGAVRGGRNTSPAIPRRIRTTRRTNEQLAADAAAARLVTVLGKALREARLRRALTQAELGRQSALAQTTISQMEVGKGASLSVRSWMRVSRLVRADLHAYLEQASAADQPLDEVHLRAQELVARTATPGGWRSVPEMAIDDAARGSRSVDLWLERHRVDRPVEVVALEVMDWFEDVGARFRDWDRRLDRVRQLATATRTLDGPGDVTLPRVSGCWVVRATQRNQQLLRDHATLFEARFPGSGTAWLAALTTSAPIPDLPAILWIDVRGRRLSARNEPAARPSASRTRPERR